MGCLGDAAVMDVFEREDGTVVHVTDREVVPGPVRGSIDWPRRFDHMQQHSGSHVLTAAFLALFDISPVSFHMGKTVSTLDVATSSISTEQLENIERFVNEIIFEDRPIHVRYGTGEALAALGVRKESEREGILRAVEIQGVDIQACGGTHVCHTGQIGMILIRRIKKVRENWRVEFVCGQRARRVARADFALVEDVSQRLTCGPDTIHAGITRILNERNAANRFGQRYLAESAALQAQLLLAKERAEYSARPARAVTGILADADMEYLRSVANNIIIEPGVVAVLGSESNGFIVLAKSDGVSGDMNALLRDAVKSCGGKGGGTKDFAQGSVPEGSDLNRILRHAAERASKPAPALHVVGRKSVSAISQAEDWQLNGKARG
jgi:alanyl-tRNA synthetase